jgi:hypothetical protein
MYGCEGFDESNNFPYWNFSRFRMDFSIKIHGNFLGLNSIEIWWKFLGTSRFDETWVEGSCLHKYGKSIHEKEIEICEFSWFLQEFDLNLFEFWHWLLRIWLIDGFESPLRL